MSCCGNGGSWFGRCGSVRNSNLSHTWYEGVQACKDREFSSMEVQKLGFPRPTSNHSSFDIRALTTSKAITAIGITQANKPMSWPPSVNASIIPQIFSVYDASTASPNATTAAISANLINLAPLLPPKAPNYAVNRTITPMIHDTIVKSMRDDLPDMPTTMSSPASDGASIHTRECVKLLRAITCVSMNIFIIIGSNS